MKDYKNYWQGSRAIVLDIKYILPFDYFLILRIHIKSLLLVVGVKFCRKEYMFYKDVLPDESFKCYFKLEL